MQITKSITARKILETYSELGKNCCLAAQSDGGYIGTGGDDTTFDLIKKDIENQNTHEKKNHTRK